MMFDDVFCRILIKELNMQNALPVIHTEMFIQQSSNIDSVLLIRPLRVHRSILSFVFLSVSSILLELISEFTYPPYSLT